MCNPLYPVKLMFNMKESLIKLIAASVLCVHDWSQVEITQLQILGYKETLCLRDSMNVSSRAKTETEFTEFFLNVTTMFRTVWFQTVEHERTDAHPLKCMDCRIRECSVAQMERLLAATLLSWK